MRVPSLNKKPVWQRFFAGTAIGGCVSWMVFLFMFGTLQERYTSLLDEQRKEIKELKGYIEIWQEDYQKLNKKNEELLLIQQIQVKIINEKRYGISDSQSILTIEEAVKQDLKSLMTKELVQAYQNKEMIKQTIENKTMNINGKRYKLVVKYIAFYTTVDIVVELKLAG